MAIRSSSAGVRRKGLADRVRGRLWMSRLQPGESARSPIPAIVGSLVIGAALAAVLLVSVAPTGSEPLVTGSVLVAFGLGWGLMALLTTWSSSQPQRWAVVPGALLGSLGLGLILFQPGPATMDLLSWAWPVALAVLAIWMVVQIRRHLRGRGRWLVLPVTAVLLACAVGGGLATVSAATGLGATTSAGRMIDVGGRRLYIECTGSGAPAVVLQSGLGESSSYWGRIASSVAATTTVCAYDRAGHGRSDAADGPQEGLALATDLHALLDGAGVVGPYVLVAHSSGGPYLRVFASRYPDAVAGVVLLDAQPADAFAALPDYPATYRTLQLIYGLSPSLARTGLLGPILGLPADQSTAAAARSARDELAVLPDVLQQAQALASFDERPLVVVTAGIGPQAGWLAAQDATAGMSTNSVHRIIASATHVSLISGVEAVDSTEAILDVVESVRTGTALR